MTDREKLAREWAEHAKNAKVSSPEIQAAAEYILAHTAPLTMDGVEWDQEKHYLAGATAHGLGETVMLWPDKEDPEKFILTTLSSEPLNRVILTPNGKRYELREITNKPEQPEHPEPSTKTMDEYSAVDRADMIGMWAGYNRHMTGGEPTDFVIITGEETEAGRVPCYNPGAPIPHAWAPDKWMLTPRFDMPRAWGKDGEPCEPTVSSGENVGDDQPDHPAVLRTVEDYENAPKGTIVSSEGCYPYAKSHSGEWIALGDNATNEEMAVDQLDRRVLRWGWD